MNLVRFAHNWNNGILCRVGDVKYSGDLTWKAGVDVLSLGATKCGALCAEAVIFFDKDLSESFIHRRKRSGHLLSKGHVFGAQFIGWLRDNHWLELANTPTLRRRN